MPALRSTLGRGAVAGIIGAAVLALWFFIFDAIRGTPLQTPEFLASALGGRPADAAGAGLIALYTVLHFALFVGVGIGVTWALERVGAPPHFLLGLVLGFLLFDLVFYAGVVITGVNIVGALGWPQVLVGNLLAGLAMFGFLQATAPAGTPSWRSLLGHSRIVREGLIAGVLAAGVVALWFLALDAAQGRVLFTPAALGSALLLGASSPGEVQTTAPIILGYTIIHVASFVLVGLLAAFVIGRAQRYPPLLLGAVLLFVTLETFVIGLLAIVATWLLEVVPWWSIAVANVLAAAAMGAYLWRAHPELNRQLRRQDLEEPVVTPSRDSMDLSSARG